MKAEQVPQDKSSLSDKELKELCYAVDDKGNYTTALSSGWEPKSVALNGSIQLIQQRVEEAKKLVLAGEKSPIVYFMEKNKMDLSILASYVSLWKWRVKRHTKPKVFKKLSSKTLQKYADVFEISVEELKNFKG
ncbi:MAG: hypothetical protein ACTJGD_09235 [Mesonia hippocampi]|uniref:hypothetical protein n=1 Tax=Mesonia hippocampi TaxID=1628250 RepID=UPI003F9B2C2A